MVFLCQTAVKQLQNYVSHIQAGFGLMGLQPGIPAML